MLLKEKDEILISELMNSLELFIKNRDEKDYINFSNKLESIFKDKSNDFIDYTINLISELNDDDLFHQILNLNIKDLMEYKEEENKNYIIFAIPYLMYNYKSMEIAEFVRKNKYFDNRLFKLKLKLEEELKKQIPTQFNFSLKLNDSLVNMQDLYRKYKNLYLMKDDIISQNNKDNSLLNNKYEKILNEKQDNLKFIIGVLEFDKNEDIEEVFEKSFHDHNLIYAKLKKDFENLILNQQMELEQFILLKPRPLMNALEEGEIEFHYHMLVNVISNVFLYRKKEQVESRIIHSSNESFIQVCFIDIDPTSNKYNESVYKIDINDYIINFNEELNIIINILKELDIKFDIIEKK
jgi:hypothetical protein